MKVKSDIIYKTAGLSLIQDHVQKLLKLAMTVQWNMEKGKKRYSSPTDICPICKAVKMNSEHFFLFVFSGLSNAQRQMPPSYLGMLGLMSSCQMSIATLSFAPLGFLGFCLLFFFNIPAMYVPVMYMYLFFSSNKASRCNGLNSNKDICYNNILAFYTDIK